MKHAPRSLPLRLLYAFLGATLIATCGENADQVVAPESSEPLSNLTVSGIDPARGLAGTTATITGARFGNQRSRINVRFKGVIAELQSFSDERIVVIVPNLPRGRAIVFVTRDGPELSDSDFTFFKILPAEDVAVPRVVADASVRLHR
jgi:hypothetical protein